LTVSDVTTAPAQPTVGEPVTITPTVSSSVGSDEPVEITAANATIDGREIDRKRNLGTLSPGDDLSVPFTTTFDEPGTYTVTFTFVGTDDAGERVSVTREETVVVSAVPAVRLTVDNVAVQPATPTAGAPVTLPITVDNSAGSTQPLEVDTVELLDGNETLASASGVGAVSAGGSITVPLTTTFDRPGQKALTARLTGTNANDEPVTVTRPVQIAVEAGAPTLEINNRSAIEGRASAISMTISNPTQGTLRNIVTTVSVDGGEAVINRRVVPALAAGAQADVEFTVRPEGAGEALLRVRSARRCCPSRRGNGLFRCVSRQRQRARASRDRISVSASTASSTAAVAVDSRRTPTGAGPSTSSSVTSATLRFVTSFSTRGPGTPRWVLVR
jgi:surface-anchored protein